MHRPRIGAEKKRNKRREARGRRVLGGPRRRREERMGRDAEEQNGCCAPGSMSDAMDSGEGGSARLEIAFVEGEKE